LDPRIDISYAPRLVYALQLRKRSVGSSLRFSGAGLGCLHVCFELLHLGLLTLALQSCGLVRLFAFHGFSEGSHGVLGSVLAQKGLDAVQALDLSDESQVTAEVAHKNLRCGPTHLRCCTTGKEEDDLDEGREVTGDKALAVSTTTAEVDLNHFLIQVRMGSKYVTQVSCHVAESLPGQDHTDVYE
jgi:hypothetical protein